MKHVIRQLSIERTWHERADLVFIGFDPATDHVDPCPLVRRFPRQLGCPRSDVETLSCFSPRFIKSQITNDGWAAFAIRATPIFASAKCRSRVGAGCSWQNSKSTRRSGSGRSCHSIVSMKPRFGLCPIDAPSIANSLILLWVRQVRRGVSLLRAAGPVVGLPSIRS